MVKRPIITHNTTKNGGSCQQIFYESSLKSNSELTFGVLKQKMIAHFKDEQSFATSFATFSSAQQYELESIRDFSVRLQSLVNKRFSEKAESELSDSFRDKMLLSQFMFELKQSIKAPVIVHDPSSFKEAVEFAITVEKSQNLVCPNINAINSSQESKLQKLKNQQSECSSKMELLDQQMALLNEQLSKLQTTGENRYPSRQAGPQNNRRIICFLCRKPGHIKEKCWKRARDMQNNARQSNQQSQNVDRPDREQTLN
ncbi:hypothetical protein AVEN_11423-1 [Araneus ventricosus]|uniref:CCHC-type domain-containing protein n=1 Tax=Araneus ventricosus TaxID=182803 RepID=A0A4Y2U278_ARAVE|nr:hypothetical protein AVEN_11420-1 [Araneus ventricosus]GBO06938.1 hypothetical protein AVEN_11423-1 [Araneus ventricosus]